MSLQRMVQRGDWVRRLNGAASAVVDGIRGLAATRDIPTGAVVLSVHHGLLTSSRFSKHGSSMFLMLVLLAGPRAFKS